MNLLADIYNFWRDNKQFWISIQNQEMADKIIYERFGEKSIPSFEDSKLAKIECIGLIIYKDQITRHIQRYLQIVDENEIVKGRKECIKILDNFKDNFWKELQEWELVFCLMPYKHLSNYTRCLEVCLDWVRNKDGKIKNFSQISKFFNDTYQKYYSFTKIFSEIIPPNSEKQFLKYNPKKICEYYPTEYISEDWLKEIKKENLVKNYPILSKIMERYQHLQKTFIVSLSGGVDSMVMLFLFKKLGLNVIAAHLIYGNRQESDEEYNFVKNYCQKLEIDIYSYKISLLKRSEISREFYEEMTKDIRFNFYQGVRNMLYVKNGRDTLPYVLLGHIRDDVIENIWTNLGRGQHLDNLMKMEEFEIQKGVTICRPFLELSKEEILKFSRKWYIPYLRNTTPSWSNRGKFRDDFYLSTHRQFGKEVDNLMLSVANQIHSQYKMVQKLLYSPILDSFQSEENIFDITTAISTELELDGWIYLIQEMCHQKLKISKPSIHSINNFVKRIKMINWEKNKNIKIQMKSDYQFHLFKNGMDDKILLKFIQKNCIN